MADKFSQVKMEEKLYNKFIEKLEEEGMTQQGFLLKQVKKFVGPIKKKKKKKLK